MQLKYLMNFLTREVLKLELIKTIAKNGVCFQCGTCASSCTKNCIEMKRNEETGLIFPEIINENNCTNCKMCEKVCPFLNIKLPEEQFKSEEIALYKSTDENIYKASSSGGVVGSVLKYLFEKKIINKALVSGIDGMYAVPRWIYSSDEIKSIQGSKYQPIALNELLKEVCKEDKIAVVGLPCHIQGIDNMQNSIPTLKNSIILKLGIFCTIGRGMNSTLTALNGFKELNNGHLIYRDENNTGNMIWRKDNEDIYVTKYEQFLDKGDYLFYPKGCLFCNDLFNVKADISVGDSWGLKKGKVALTLVRTLNGLEIINDMKISGYIEFISNVSKHQAESTQKHSYDFKIKKYEERYKLCRHELKGLPIELNVKPSKTSLKYNCAIRLLNFNSDFFNSTKGVKICNNKKFYTLVKKYRNFILRNCI